MTNTDRAKAAPPVPSAYRTLVEHTVRFIFDSPGDVVRTTDSQWASLTTVTIHLYDNRKPSIWAGGRRCRKDGSRDRRLIDIGVSAELPDPDVWIERARAAVRDASTHENTEQPVPCGECGGTGWKRGFVVDGVMGGMHPTTVHCDHAGRDNTDSPVSRSLWVIVRPSGQPGVTYSTFDAADRYRSHMGWHASMVRRYDLAPDNTDSPVSS